MFSICTRKICFACRPGWGARAWGGWGVFEEMEMNVDVNVPGLHVRLTLNGAGREQRSGHNLVFCWASNV